MISSLHSRCTVSITMARTSPPHPTQFRHMVLLWSWYLCISEAFSFLWNSEFHTNSTLWNSMFHTMDLMFHNVECKSSTLVPHKIHSICFIMITEIPHNFHTNSIVSFHNITTLILHSAWVPYRGKGKKLWNSTSTVFPRYFHTSSTL